MKACFDRRSKLCISDSLVKASFDAPSRLINVQFQRPWKNLCQVTNITLIASTRSWVDWR